MGLEPADASNVASNVASVVIDVQPTTTTTTTIAPLITEIPSDGKWNIEICIHCFRYQRRLTWMLSSLLQQQGDVPNLTVNISHTDDDGTPTTAEVCKFFRDKGLNIVETVVTKEEVSNRALARNRQSSQTTAHWVLFADSDMVYDTGFFADLSQQLKGQLKDTQVVMGADRISLDDKFCTDYFNEQDKTQYPRVIENVAQIVKDFKAKWKTGRGRAPGNFQLISGRVLREKCKGKITDRPGDHWRRTKGDRALRARVGGSMGIITKDQWHLNHDRSGPDIQR